MGTKPNVLSGSLVPRDCKHRTSKSPELRKDSIKVGTGLGQLTWRKDTELIKEFRGGGGADPPLSIY